LIVEYHDISPIRCLRNRTTRALECTR